MFFDYSFTPKREAIITNITTTKIVGLVKV